MWICHDLSNKARFKQYVWVFETKEEAQAQYEEHKKNPDFANLSKPVRWSKARLEKLYAPIGGRAKPNYWGKKDA